MIGTHSPPTRFLGFFILLPQIKCTVPSWIPIGLRCIMGCIEVGTVFYDSGKAKFTINKVMKDLCHLMYCLSIGYTPRCRSLRDLHYRGPQARGGIGSVETEPRCVTDLYNGAMGYVALTTHLRPSNYSIGHKRLERVPSNNSNHRSSRVLLHPQGSETHGI